MTRVSRNNPVVSLLQRGVLGLSLCALLGSLAGCGRDTTHAEPDPAKVTVEVEPGQPGLKKPLAIPQENKDEAENTAIVAEPVAEQASETQPKAASEEGNDVDGTASASGETKRADVKAVGSAPLKIKRLVVTTEIDKREPVEVSSFEASSGPIYAFMELENPGDEDRDVMLTFEHSSGKKVGLVELHIPAKQRRWRTWGRTQNIKQAGEWEAIVKSSEGQEIGRTKFQVGAKTAEKAADEESGSETKPIKTAQK
ncbi:MAG: DUF2914 domain-containing protein [Myxococcales bacterium]|nr:DUF2914 domain-containing protein [Myxococcales bacterium]